MAAITVHGVCGAWGTLATGLFNAGNMFDMSIVSVQLIGIAACFLWTFPASFVAFKVVDKAVGLRVNARLEQIGLDLHEHDNMAYPEFLPEDELALAEV